MALRLIEKQVIYTGSRIRLEVQHLEDEAGKRVLKEVCVHPGAVVILPFVAPDQIILIRNRRFAVGQTLLELPAGTLEKNEDPINAAGRELLEETGYLAGRLKSLGSFFASPGILSERLYAYAAFDLQPGTRDLEDDEEIELAPVSFDHAVEMIRDGEIHDGKTIATLLMYDKFHRASHG